MNTKIILGFIFVVAAIGLAAAGYSSTTSISANAVASNTTGSVVKVQAGGGDTSAPLTTFSPQQVQIKVCDSVSWYNPSIVGEPHTVSFIFDNKSMAQFVGPFGVSSSTQFIPLPPGSNNEPLILPGKNGMNTLISLNARAYNPVAIDSSGNVKTLNPNANYTLSGTEKYVNSGFILPKGHDQNFPGSSNTFTVTFQKAGTYNYLCIVHPWMVGKVIVK
jgi:plastocyanin